MTFYSLSIWLFWSIAFVMKAMASDPTAYEMGEIERYKFKMWQNALEKHHLNQEDINSVLIDAVFCGHQEIVKLVINLPPEEPLRPEKASVNTCFYRAHSTNNVAFVKMLVALPMDRRPDQNMINSAHHGAVLNKNTEMIGALTPYVLQMDQ